jgi:predicted site-specific integrase-resolvase
MKDLQRENEVQLQPTIQVKQLPLLLRPKQTCELFGIDLKALHKLETSGRVKAVRIGPKKVQRRYSPVAVAKALGVDLMAENYTLVAGIDFARELGGKLAGSSDAVLTKTRQLIKDELQGLRQSVGEIVRSEINNALQNTVVKRRPDPPPQDHRIRDYVPPPMPTGY